MRSSLKSNSASVRGKSTPQRRGASPDSKLDGKIAIKEIDALFKAAGLVRSLKGKAGAGVKRPARREQVSAEELFREAPVPQVAENGVQWLPVAGWEKMPWLWHGFSTRLGGVSRAYCADDAPGELNLAMRPEDDAALVRRNRELLAEAVTGNGSTPVVTVNQVHGNVLVVAGPGEVKRERRRTGDGLMTAQPGILLGVETADCIPVLVADRKQRSVGVFHAGWRGTVKRIVECGVARMRLEFGSRPEDLVAAIGPGIGQCCYAVSEDVLSEFESQFQYAQELFREVYSVDAVRNKYPMLFLTQRAPGHSPIGPSLHLDLVEANRRQLLAAGVKASRIQTLGSCTNCLPELFFSHRASSGRTGRILSFIGIAEDAAGKKKAGV